MRREWLRMTIAEPFPVCAPIPGCTYTGPYYAAGSVWYELPENRAFVDWKAAHLRAQGYTVTIDTEVR